MENKRVIVVKVGSSSLVSEQGVLRYEVLNSLAAQIARARVLGYKTVVVTSGATLLGLAKEPRLQLIADEIARGQMAAFLGQVDIAGAWQATFSLFGIRAGQLLRTHQDFANGSATEFLDRVLTAGFVPVINEDDTRSAEEMTAYIEEKGDNDKLAVHVAKAVRAERVFLLTDVDGVCAMSPAGKPNSEPISIIERVDETIWKLVSQNVSSRPTGMRSKLEAADRLQQAGITAHIANAAKWVIVPILEGQLIGTTFPAH